MSLFKQYDVANEFNEALTLSGDRGEIPESFRVLIPKLLSIIAGERNKALTDDLALHSVDAAELLFFIERLGENRPDKA